MSHEGYDRRMTIRVASRELRNDTARLLRRVEAGEDVVITVRDRDVARLTSVDRRPRWMSRELFARTVLAHQADSALTVELDALLPETTDDLPL